MFDNRPAPPRRRYFHELAHTELQQDAGRGAVRRECTGLVLQDSAGAVWHSGNMDQSPPAVRNVTLQVAPRKNTHSSLRRKAAAEPESAFKVVGRTVQRIG